MLGLMPLAGCGFQPAYGTDGVAADLQGRVALQDPSERDEFDLVARFEDRLGRPNAPIYDLSYSLRTDEDGLGISAQQEITRYNVLGYLDFVLRDRRTGLIVAQGSTSNFTGYSATGNTITTVTAQRDAYARLMVLLADQTITRILAVLAADAS